MTGLFDPEKGLVTAPTSRPIVTISVSLAGLAALVTLALKLGLFASIGAATTADLKIILVDHNVMMNKQAETLDHALARIARLLEIRCMHDAATDADRSACLQP